MELQTGEFYLSFDQCRKQEEAQQADQEDEAEFENLVSHVFCKLLCVAKWGEWR